MSQDNDMDQESRNGISDPLSFARNIALQQLNYAPRSRKELLDKMTSKAVPPDIAEQVLDRLTEVGLIDDRAYAQMLVRSKQNSRKLAKRALSVELSKKGITGEVAQEVLGEISDDDERELARAAVDKKLRSMSALDIDTVKRRLSGLLARKGFSSAVSMAVIREALAQRASESELDDLVLD